MKFNIKLALILLCISIFIITISSFKSHSKREKTMMEYLDTFFSEGGEQNLSEEKQQKEEYDEEDIPDKSSSKHKKYRFKEKSSKDLNFNWLNNSVIISGWLMISTEDFKDDAIFPVITLPNNKQASVETTMANYRVNKVYDYAPTTSKPPNKYDFWFRLSGDHLYYTATNSDLNVLGVMRVKEISNIAKGERLPVSRNSTYYCFTVNDKQKSLWKLCQEKEDDAKKFRCTIKNVVTGADIKGCVNEGEDDDDDGSEDQTTIEEPVVIIPLPSKFCNERWNYQVMGRDWNCDCSDGKEQSPIDLPKSNESIDSPVKPMFQYDEVDTKTETTGTDGQVKETKYMQLYLDHGLMKMNHTKFGKLITVDGAIYHAQEILIHTPAEHTINGKKFEMEIQIIHYGVTKGDIAKQAILCFLIDQKPGVYNKFIEDLDIFNLPTPIRKTVDLTNKIYIPKIFYSTDSEDSVIMKSFSFYTYQGSLSAPPCTENTIVYVASDPIFLGSTALTLFKEALRVPDMMDHKGNVIVSDTIPKNSRATQPLNGRPVFHYDHEKYCGPDAQLKKNDKIRGHYEKVATAVTKYFYVNSEKPSGIPNAYVVSNNEAKGKPEDLKPIKDR
jgi:carbonic anhydrase